MQMGKRAIAYFLCFGMAVLLSQSLGREKIRFTYSCTVTDIALEGWYEVQ